jgi:hypothetical protein
VTATAMDRDHDASFARIRLTSRGSILYRSIAIENGRPEEGGRVAVRQPSVTIATSTSRPRTGVLTRTQNWCARRRQTRTQNRRTGVLDDVKDASLRLRAAERRAAPVPDVACARRWIAFATGCRHPSFDHTTSHLPCCPSHPSLDDRRPTRVEGHPRNSGITPSWIQARRVLASELRSKQEPNALLDEPLTLRWCSSP